MKLLRYTLISLMLPTISLASSNQFQVMGRILWEDDASILAFPGITLESVVTGTKAINLDASLISGEEAYFNIWINGHALEPLHVTEDRNTYNLASRLDPGKTYQLRLVKRTETWQGKVRIFGLSGDDSAKFQKPAKQSTRRIMTIGDSITCGAAAEVKEPYTRDGHYSSNAEASYGYVLAKKLDAQIHIVGYGGKGLIRDWQGMDSEVTAPQFFERIDPDDPTSIWNHAQYIPDGIIICLGQNDFNQGVIDQDTYVYRYIAFCNRILKVYPNAKILICSSPMMGLEDPKRLTLQKYLGLVQQHFEAKNIFQIRSHNSGLYNGSSLNAHPTVDQHAQFAEELYPAISEWLNWID